MAVLTCKRCKEPLYWEITINGNDDSVGISNIAYQTVKDNSYICEASVCETHIVKIPAGVKAVADFVKWLDEQIQEEAVDREHSIA